MDHQKKKALIKDSGTHPKDTGSAHVQIAILSERIKVLTEHLKTHPKDNHSRRGLFGLVGKRRKQLQYLKQNNPQAYQEVMETHQLGKQGKSSSESASEAVTL